MRKDLLVEGEIYHVFNKSIAGYTIFNKDTDFFRMMNVILFYQRGTSSLSFSNYIRTGKSKQSHANESIISLPVEENKSKLIEIIAYCIMPTHLHLVLRQLKLNGISIFMNNIQNSYTRYFNTKHKRKGPLWESRFKNVLVKTDEQLLHLTRYIHLNPVTAYLVDKPEKWVASSYQEYVSVGGRERICEYEDWLEIEPVTYKKFVEDRVSYQRDLAKIKGLILDESLSVTPFPTA